MSTEQNKINARRIVDESWNKHNTKLLDELFSNDAILHNPQDPTVAKGPQGAKTSLETYLTAFPDVKITIEKEIADGDYVVQHLRAIGTNTGSFNGMPATGKKANTTGAMTTKFDQSGKIVEVWSFFDNLTLMQQLGVVPMPEVATRREPVHAGSR
ncbi:MAG: ester cyclase [Chloroflexota bacterium]|nr:ester cyclase [Chloroflexota bacterium]